MRSVKARFNDFREKNPGFSDFVVFGMAVEGQEFNKKSICTWFDRLVPKSDWKGCGRIAIIKHFLGLNKKLVRTYRGESKLPQERRKVKRR
jgi:hypothetical protein